MVLKRKWHTPQGYITAGMAFFLIGIFASMVADGRLIGELFISLIPDETFAHTIQVFANGFSIPLLMASIYFQIRGLKMLR
jgi:hypothetical protein